MRAALISILLTLAGTATAQTLPGLVPRGTADPRHPVDMAVPPWRGVARLQIPGVSRCTAVLVAPALALTAAHCLYSIRLGHFAPAESVHVIAGYASGAGRAATIATSLRIAPEYDPLHPAAHRDADFALVTLARPIIDPAGTLHLLARPPAPDEAAMLGGYSQDRAEILTADTSCRLRGAMIFAGATMLEHDCAGTSGTSGAPLLVRDGPGWAVAGLEVAAARGQALGLAIPAEWLRPTFLELALP